MLSVCEPSSLAISHNEERIYGEREELGKVLLVTDVVGDILHQEEDDSPRQRLETAARETDPTLVSCRSSRPLSGPLQGPLGPGCQAPWKEQ